MNERKQVLHGALFHDSGKLWQRTFDRAERPKQGKHQDLSRCFIEEHSDLFSDSDAVAKFAGGHHKRSEEMSEGELVVSIADWLASAERIRDEEQVVADPAESALVAITSRVSLAEPVPTASAHSLSPLELSDVIFPCPADEAGVEPAKFRDLWRRFTEDMRKLKQQDDIITLLSLMRRYTSFIPSVTPFFQAKGGAYVPDVSLYEHSRVTMAIAACLTTQELERQYYERSVLSELRMAVAGYSGPLKFNLDTVLFSVLAIDITGIQNYIYTIAQPGGSTRGVARRLRGRSFYVNLLVDVFARFIVKQLDLTPANILLASGGKLLVLAQNLTAEEVASRCFDSIESWLLKQYDGDLGIATCVVPVSLGDFKNFDAIYRRVDEALAEAKRHKFARRLDENFFQTQKGKQVCRSCNRLPLSEADLTKPQDEQVCCQCEQHARIGQLLPKIDRFIWRAPDSLFIEADESLDLKDFRDLGVRILLTSEDDWNRVRHQLMNESAEIQWFDPSRLFRSEIIPHPDLAENFEFLTNRAPRWEKEVDTGERFEERPNVGDVLSFEHIAELSEGVKLLGLLKMDVDLLGLIFGVGLQVEKKAEQSHRTISRLATLSSAFDVFFAGWLNNICDGALEDWKNRTNHPWRDAVSNIFYVVYSGGDDLLIIGPWNETLWLAKLINDDFQKFTRNPDNIHLSAGLVLTKPKFPIQRSTELVTEAIEASKNAGRNHITAFGAIVEWDEFAELLEIGEHWSSLTKNGKPLPRGFFHDLWRLQETFYNHKTKKRHLGYIPRLHYQLSRNISPEYHQTLLEPFTKFFGRGITIPLNYVSLITREE